MLQHRGSFHGRTRRSGQSRRRQPHKGVDGPQHPRRGLGWFSAECKEGTACATVDSRVVHESEKETAEAPRRAQVVRLTAPIARAVRGGEFPTRGHWAWSPGGANNAAVVVITEAKHKRRQRACSIRCGYAVEEGAMPPTSISLLNAKPFFSSGSAACHKFVIRATRNSRSGHEIGWLSTRRIKRWHHEIRGCRPAAMTKALVRGGC